MEVATLYVDSTLNEKSKMVIIGKINNRLKVVGIDSRIETADDTERVIEKMAESTSSMIGIVGRNSCSFAKIPDFCYLGKIGGTTIIGNSAGKSYFCAYQQYQQERLREQSAMILGRANHRAGLL